MKHKLTFAAACILAAACTPQQAGSGSAAPAPAPAPASVVAANENQRLDQLAEEFFERGMALDPVGATSVGDTRYNHLYTPGFSRETRALVAARVAEYAPRLQAINRAALDEEHQITYDVFRWSMENQRRAQQFPSHLVPLNQFFNFTAGFVQLGAGTGVHPFRTVKDYEDFLSRMRGFQQAVDVAIANMREGMAAGVVQPRVLMERVLPQLSAHVVDDPTASLFWGPIKNLPASFSTADRERLTAQYNQAIREVIVPTFRKLHDFVRDEYLPRTRATVGLSALPNGRAWYENQVRALTTTNLTPEQIHEIGLAEVARIHREMETVMRQVGWQGDL
ncbi:MAG TPA: DUF885 family protein, partial [Longimicrobium sp.]|nr:DUF885 family protein [Longimicrobium sp.]